MNRIPGQAYLWLAVVIFGASSAVTRKLTEIGAHQFRGEQNPISLCNVLFVGNLCALLVLLIIYRRQWHRATLRQLSQQQWLGLILVAILAGALAPGLIFQALSLTPVTNVVLVGRLEPPLTLALSFWLLRERVNAWQVLGAIAAFLGVALTIVLQPVREPMIQMAGFQIGGGELLAALGAIALAIASILGKQWLSKVPLGIFSIVRTGLGTLIFFGVALVLYGPRHFMGAFSPFLWQWMLLYGVIIVVVGQSFWIVGTRASSVSTASIVGSCVPIAGILAAYLILGEVPIQAQYIGGIVILLGLCLGQIGIQRQIDPKAAMGSMRSVPTEQAIAAKMGFKGI
ncbi:membrane protein [Neosynechococcus sphagnicola sy1]|uniref:Membrane protein n=1 Tax=Neosynechococcus sphagnicola sy1 TaxID=1497020 RepID=A0A098TIS4_9CYAN|nr:membrane protein [Neosynechococcus sphagnicola sy1]